MRDSTNCWRNWKARYESLTQLCTLWKELCRALTRTDTTQDINELIAARNTQLASDDQFDTQLRKRSKEGELFPRNVDVEVGDKVLFDKYSGTEVKVDGEELLVLREGDILAVIELRGED